MKLKSETSIKLFTDYVKRYFILDLDNKLFGYKLNQNSGVYRKKYNLNTIIRVHQYAPMSHSYKGSKNILKEWQYDFMIELNE